MTGNAYKTLNLMIAQVIFFGAHFGSVAQAQHSFSRPSCSEILESSCTQMTSISGGIISMQNDGSINFNPLRSLAEYTPTERFYTQIENANQTRFENQIVPVFEELRKILLAELSKLPSKSVYKNLYLIKVSEMKFVVRDRERCQRLNRPPIVAGYDKVKNELMLCPIQTHQSAFSLVSTLGHEMGHAVDLCSTSGIVLKILNSWSTCDGSEPELLNGFFARSIHCCSAKALPYKKSQLSKKSLPTGICERESEVYADFIGTYLTSRYLEKKQQQIKNDSFINQLDMMGLRFESTCSTDPLHQNFRYNTVQSNEINAFLGCSGISSQADQPVCSLEDLAPL